MSDVFVPGGLPQHTYIPRGPRGLEERLAQAKDNLCKLVTVTGATKSGKTVLAKKIFPKKESIWVDGGTVSEEKDLWTQVLDQLEGFTEIENTSVREKNFRASGKIGGQMKLFPFLGGTGEIETGLTRKGSKGITRRRQSSPKSTGVALLREAGKSLVIDDFHYLKREIQGTVVRALKGLVFDGHPVVVIAIPHRRYDAVKVEREMTQRIENIQIPAWEPGELEDIPSTGFKLLNVELEEHISQRLANEALGSPHLMQEFCRELCHFKKIEETQKSRLVFVPTFEELGNLFKNVAENTGRTMFEKLAKGPRQRADRKSRKLADGTRADIYVVVLKALAQIKPGVETIGYEDLRTAIRNVLSGDIPQAHEVSRVLEHMARISAEDEASIPVIDWDKEERVLHVTDPFFAYYLRWGKEGGITRPG